MMDTHEHLLSDEDLPGHGVLDANFAREMVRQQEAEGVIIWNDEDESYEPSARMILGRVGVAVLAKAAEIDPRATHAEIMATIFGTIPFVGESYLQEVSAEEFEKLDLTQGGFVVGSDGETTKVHEIPDTFPEDWAADDDAQ
jgi:hypothetical protein